MTDQELLEFIAAQEKSLKDALAQLGRMRARVQRGETVTVGPRADVAVSTSSRGWETTTRAVQ